MIRALKAAAIDTALTVSRVAGLHAVPILMYHAIADEDSDLCVTPWAFREQMAWLRDTGHRVISLDRYAAALDEGGLRRLGKAVVLTFDDGYRNNLEQAAPVLRSHDFSATFFIATGHVGSVTGWLPKPWPVMTWDELRECQRLGITIGAHTISHPHLTQISEADARREIVEGKRELEEKIGKPVMWLCYPYGDHGEREERLALEAGFRGAVSVNQGNSNRREDLFRLRRFYIGRQTDLRHFALAFSRLYAWKHDLLKRLLRSPLPSGERGER